MRCRAPPLSRPRCRILADPPAWYSAADQAIGVAYRIGCVADLRGRLRQRPAGRSVRRDRLSGRTGCQRDGRRVQLLDRAGRRRRPSGRDRLGRGPTAGRTTGDRRTGRHRRGRKAGHAAARTAIPVRERCCSRTRRCRPVAADTVAGEGRPQVRPRQDREVCRPGRDRLTWKSNFTFHIAGSERVDFQGFTNRLTGNFQFYPSNDKGLWINCS